LCSRRGRDRHGDHPVRSVAEFDLDTLIFCSPFLARRSFALSARPFFGQPLSRFCCSLISVGGRHERKSMKSMKSMIFYFIFFGSLARQAPDKLTP
jgi:hypothetical protein